MPNKRRAKAVTGPSGAIRDQAWSRFTQGQAAEAVEMVRGLIARLERDGLAGGEDAGWQIALGNAYLGRVYDHAGRSHLAVEPLQKAVAAFEKADGSGNLSGALGNLANALCHLGQHGAALDAAEALAQMAEQPPPLGPTGAFLRAVAAKKPVPELPPDLPPKLAEILAALAKAVGR